MKPSQYLEKWLFDLRLTILPIFLIASFNVEVSAQTDFSIPIKICEGERVTFINLSSTDTARLDSFRWDFEGAEFQSSSENDAVWPIIGLTKSFTVRLTQYLSNGDSANIQKSVNVKEAPVLDFEVPLSCYGDETEFINKSPNSTLMYTWEFGDGPSSRDTGYYVSHLYDADGVYSVTLSASNSIGCSNQITTHVEVNPLPNANFSVEYPKDIFLLEAEEYADKYRWSTGGRTISTDRNFSIARDEIADWEICLFTEHYGCSNESCETLNPPMLSAEEQALNSFSIYPNPSSENFTVDFMKSQAPKSIRVLNLLGVEIMNVDLDNQSSDFDFSLATQPGVYYLHLMYEGTIVTRQIIKK
jgi:hypothetical protein